MVYLSPFCSELRGLMDLVDGIRVFVAAVETGSFSGAAARLGMSPKLASKYMAELESRLGAQLLQRTTRRLGLTAAGERLMGRAPDWLDLLEDMTGDLRAVGRGVSGTLRLSDSFVDLAADGIDVAIRIGRLDDSALIARKLGQSGLLLVASPGYLAED